MPLDFPGRLLPFAHHYLLVYGPDAEALGAPLFGPPVDLRPGYRCLTRDEYLLPVEVVDDIGQRFPAPDCYAWIEQRGDAFPRADMIGVLASSAEKHSAFMKEMDLVEMAVFAGPVGQIGSLPCVRVGLAIEASAVPDGFALVPMAPGVFGAVGAAIITQLLASGRRDWKLTFDDIDDRTGA